MTPEQMTPEQLKKFLVYYRKRIERDPQNVEARLRLATVFREMGQRRRAIEQYEAAAQLLDEQGLALEAIAACKAILELDPSRVEAQYLLARLYAQTPDATDQSARVAQPVDVAEDSEAHELVHEADEASDHPEELASRQDNEELFETQEWEAEPEEDEQRTRVADYEELPAEEWGSEEVEEEGESGEPETIELTPEEKERREGFSREEMQELLTTIDVDPEDIVDVEDVEDYEFEDQLVEEMDEEVGPEEPDFELSEDLEVDEASGGDADQSDEL